MDVHTIELPSRGIPYGGKLPEGKVQISAMTAREEALFLGTQERTEIIDLLVKRCLKSNSLPFEEMLVSDKFYVFLMIRNVTYGADYTCRVTCPTCGAKFPKDIHVPEDMLTRVMDESDTEPYELTLPKSGKKVWVRLLRNSDEADIRAMRMGKRGKFTADDVHFYTIAKHIVSIDKPPSEESEKKMSMPDLLNFCADLHAVDSQAIRDCVDDHDCGISLILRCDCTSCGYEIDYRIHGDKEFFRADTAGHRDR